MIVAQRLSSQPLGCSAGRRTARAVGRKPKYATDSEEEPEEEEEEEGALLVEDSGTKKFTNWAFSYRGRWARWAGQHSLPSTLAKKAAKR